MATLAARASEQLEDKTNVNPSINRKHEATAEDFVELGLIISDHADRLDWIFSILKPNTKFVGFYGSLSILNAAVTDANQDDYAFIVDAQGIPTNIVIYKSGVWEVQDTTENIVFYDNVVDFPETGTSNKFYIATTPSEIYLWYNDDYNQIGKDGENGLSAFEIAVAEGYSGTVTEWLDSLKGAVSNLPFSFHYVSIDFEAAGSTRSKVATAINGWDNTQLPLGHAIAFFTHRFINVKANGISVTEGNEFAVITELFFLTKQLTPSGGIISVGDSGENISQTDLLPYTPLDTRNLSFTEINLGDIEEEDIHTAINSAGPYNTPKPEAVVVRATQDETEKLWLYIGPLNTIGSGETATEIQDFLAFPVNEEDADPDDDTITMKVIDPTTGFESPLKLTFGEGFSISQDLDGSAIINYKDKVEIEEDDNYETLASMILDQSNQKKGMILFVENASAHSKIDEGYAFFEYLGTTNNSEDDYRIISTQLGDVDSQASSDSQEIIESVDSVNGKTGDVVLFEEDIKGKVVTVADAGSTYEIDYQAGSVWHITLTENCTLTDTNYPAEGFSRPITLVVVHDGYSLTMPSGYEKLPSDTFGDTDSDVIRIEPITTTSKLALYIVQNRTP